ncbi:thiolase family protein [Blastococcus sp. TF02A-26]|uniref:thiolase family protein n=1 Tax=Blastococcus sp. TF02A-26 TaxID=2250577 RepID=UPI000DE826F5|nr:thiolase family protein [Blastococcus sp. TF02A-26]RBY81796.1 acetyl-CoA C-acyltransferase [Blastococcus sp. TF02A-26]
MSDAPVIVAARRTPIGTAGHALATCTAADLAAAVVADLAGGLGDVPLREVVLGNCMGPGGDVARVAALQAGLPATVPGLTVDRQCGSGLAAIVLAVAQLRAGETGAVLAGGVESASTAPWRMWPPRGDDAPVRYERAPFAPSNLGDPDMGPAAELVAREHGIGREEQDAYAARSHARAVAIQQAGGFDDELVPVGGLDRDERPRAGLTVERLARLRPAFEPGGAVTVGNSCGINDGAAAVTLVDAGTHRRLGVPGLRVLATATAGVDPTRPGLGIVPAARQALDRAGLGLDDVDVIEFNEAFAGQVLACCAELELDPERVCREGGALALGHPWGASGAVLAVRLFSQLVRGGAGRTGLAAIAVGGGQGVAMVVETC